MISNTQKLHRDLERNSKFFEKFAKEHPHYYDHPLLDEAEGSAFIKELHDEYAKHPEHDDPLPNISLNIAEDQLADSELNVVFHRITTHMPAMMHYSEFFEIRYIQTGTAMFYTGDETLTLRSGNLILIPPKLHSCFEIKEKDSIVYNILLKASTIDSVFFNLFQHDEFLAAYFTRALYGSKTGYILWDYEPNPMIDRLITASEKEFWGERPYYQRKIEIYLLEIFVELLRTGKEKSIFPITPTLTSKDITFLLTKLLRDSSYTITLSDAATMCGYSSRQLERILKQQTGYSFSELKQQTRFRQAHSMLKNSELSVSDIAQKLGFKTSSAFVKAFRIHHQMTPAEWRKHHHPSVPQQ